MAASSVSIETVTSYTTAAQALRRMRQPSLAHVRNQMNELCVAIRAARILRELTPEKLGEYGPNVLWLDAEEERQSLGAAAMEAIGAIAPLDEEVLDTGMQDGIFRLVPATMGYPMSWDQWSEIVADPDGYLDPDSSAWAFCSALAIGDQQAFENFSEYFGWRLRWPKRAGANYDKQKMFRGFDRRGLGCFKAAWNISIYDTGNLYFDYNIYEDNLNLPDFDIDGVRELEEQYQAALPIRTEYWMAQDLFLNQADVPAALLRIYVRSLVKGEVQEKKSNRLVDILGQDEENDETDPFHALERLAENAHAIDRALEELGTQLRVRV